jgi:UDP-GlcNAc:undecaprenyl-phosphate GlcNAc-1-phosphate transferase
MDVIGGDPGAHSLLDLLDQGDRLIAKAGAKFPILGRLLAHGTLTTRGLLLALAGLLLLLLLPPLIGGLLRRANHLQPNFRNEAIPQSYGMVILLWAGLMFGLAAALFPPAWPTLRPWLLTVLGFGLLGLIDDLRGDRRIKGLRGHFRAAFRDRVITTGLLKAVGGALLALWIGLLVAPNSLPEALLDAALIALCANAINLLDLRPGRAGAVFLVCAAWRLLLGLRAGEWEAGVPPLLFVVLPTLPVYERDARARVMLGDAGSNLLGACLGLSLATSPLPVSWKVVALLFLIGLHSVAERVSLTRLIERNAVLRALDRLTGVR